MKTQIGAEGSVNKWSARSAICERATARRAAARLLLTTLLFPGTEYCYETSNQTNT